ncbi:Bestrophin, RFP-TM, chloride channel-domain-containing protein [Chytriomyces sp. MP71]|nr:Bestrophin, RFP-TM, chloride channel-domain-containing protein [Chytriomyces sp. MP71]
MATAITVTERTRLLLENPVLASPPSSSLLQWLQQLCQPRPLAALPPSLHSWQEALDLSSSTAFQTAPKAALAGAWAFIVCLLALVPGFAFLDGLPFSQAFAKCTGTALSLLLAFCTSNAYNRYSQAAKLWTTIRVESIKTTIDIKFGFEESTDHERALKKIALNCIIGFSSAVKHRLRNEREPLYDDLFPYICHMPDLAPATSSITRNIPLDIVLYLQSYATQRQRQLASSLSALTESATQLDALADTPLPRAYALHVHQFLAVYFLALPFQLLDELGWLSVPAAAICAYVMLGLLDIAGAIAASFPRSVNHLPMERYCGLTEWDVGVVERFERVGVEVRGEAVEDEGFGIALWDVPLGRERDGSIQRLLDLNELEKRYQKSKKGKWVVDGPNAVIGETLARKAAATGDTKVEQMLANVDSSEVLSTDFNAQTSESDSAAFTAEETGAALEEIVQSQHVSVPPGGEASFPRMSPNGTQKNKWKGPLASSEAK